MNFSPFSPKTVVVGSLSYNNQVHQEIINLFIEAGCSGHAIVPVFIEKQPTDIARNRIVKAALDCKADAVMMIDSDCVPPNGVFLPLLTKVLTHQCVAACPYVAKHGGVCVAFKEPKTMHEIEKMTGWHEVQTCGTHLIAFTTSVFNYIPMPWFHYEYNSTHTGFRAGAEDTVFLNKVNKEGIPIYVNFDLWAGHILPRVATKPKALTMADINLLATGVHAGPFE